MDTITPQIGNVISYLLRTCELHSLELNYHRTHSDSLMCELEGETCRDLSDVLVEGTVIPHTEINIQNLDTLSDKKYLANPLMNGVKKVYNFRLDAREEPVGSCTIKVVNQYQERF